MAMSTQSRSAGVARSVAASLVLGTLTTVAVAWALALSVNTVMYPKVLTFRQTPGAQWSVQEFARAGVRSEVWTPIDWAGRTGERTAEFDVRASQAAAAPGIVVSSARPRVIRMADVPVESPQCGELIEHCRGWPMLALGCATTLRFEPGGDGRQTVYGFDFRPGRPPEWDVDLVHLPLKPLFPGFYANTLLFGAAFWAALFWRPLRRRRRIERGLCPACAYSLAGLPANADRCPECGAAAPTAAGTFAAPAD